MALTFSTDRSDERDRAKQENNRRTNTRNRKLITNKPRTGKTSLMSEIRAQGTGKSLHHLLVRVRRRGTQERGTHWADKRRIRSLNQELKLKVCSPGFARGQRKRRPFTALAHACLGRKDPTTHSRSFPFSASV